LRAARHDAQAIEMRERRQATIAVLRRHPRHPAHDAARTAGGP
jgi:hypothetical protein